MLYIFVPFFVLLLSVASFPALATEIENEEEGDIVDTAVIENKQPLTVGEGSDSTVHLPKAKSVKLDQPVLPTLLNTVAKDSLELTDPEIKKALARQLDVVVEEVVEPDKPILDVQPPLMLLGAEVPPATATRLSWSPSQSFEGIASPSPVLVVNGAKPGPTLCLTAAIHGDELNGIEIVRRILYQLNPEKLSGAVIGVPIVNLQGFRRSSRYLTDRRDLNRFFPGNEQGSSAARIAHSIFTQVIAQCDVLVDLHTGSFYRENLPQLRADLHDPDIVKLTHNFGSIVVVHSAGAQGTLRGAAVAAGIPAVTLEAGGPMRLEKSAVEHGVKSIQTLLNKMKMVKKIRLWSHPEPVYYGSTWIRVDQGGILFSEVKLGGNIKKGEVLGTVTDPITNVSQDVLSPFNGMVIGMAINQVVMPGFAAYHIGIAAEDDGELKNPDDVNILEKTPVESAALVVPEAMLEPLNDSDIVDMND